MSDRPLWLSKVEELARSIAERESCFLYDLDYVGAGRGRTLRVFVDTDAGAGIEECSNVSKALNSSLDELDLIPGGEYHLEVSTPGVDRVLRLPWHFEKVVGKKIWLRLSQPLIDFGMQRQALQNAKKFEATLNSYKSEIMKIEVQLPEGDKVEIPLDKIEKAQLVFNYSKDNEADEDLSASKKKKKIK